MANRNFCRSVKQMTLSELQHELALIRPFIRDVLESKQARIDDLKSEIARREKMPGRTTGSD